MRDIAITGVVDPLRRNAGLGKVLEDALNVEQRLALNIERDGARICETAVIEGAWLTKGDKRCGFLLQFSATVYVRPEPDVSRAVENLYGSCSRNVDLFQENISSLNM